jgi:hypothetical protein
MERDKQETSWATRQEKMEQHKGQPAGAEICCLGRTREQK